MPRIQRLPAAMLITAAVAFPASATAASATGAPAVAQASAHAELQMAQVPRLVEQGGRAAITRARVLVAHSRAELRNAAAQARTMAAHAAGAAQAQAAINANGAVSHALSNDTRLLSTVAVQGHGSVQSSAASALVSDARLQAQALQATLQRAGDGAEGPASIALAGAASEVQGIDLQAHAAATVNGSSQASEQAQDSAELAVGIETDAITNAATRLSALQARVDAAVQAISERLKQSMADAAAAISTDIGVAGIGDDTVTVNGDGPMSLSTLAQLSVSATTPATSGDQGAAAQGSLQAGLLG